MFLVLFFSYFGASIVIFLSVIRPILLIFVLFFFFLTDFSRLFFSLWFRSNQFNCWSIRYSKNELYSLFDFFSKDLKKIKIFNIIKFLIISGFHKIISLWHVFSAVDWFILSFFFHLSLETRGVSTFYLVFVIFPRALAVSVKNKFKTKKINYEEIKIFIINISYLTVIRRSRWNINNSLIFLTNFNEIRKDPNWPTRKLECFCFIVKISSKSCLVSVIEKIKKSQ